MSSTNTLTHKRTDNLPFFCLLVSCLSKKSGGRVDDLCVGNAIEGSELLFNSVEDSGFGNSLADWDLALFDRFSAAALALNFSIAWARNSNDARKVKRTVILIDKSVPSSSCWK